MRKNIMVVSYDKDKYPPSEENGIMEIEYPGEISNQDDLVAALLSNSPFMIELKHVLMSRGQINHNAVVQKFRLDFFDDYQKDPYLEDYLASDESDYRATRLSDGTIIRISNEDYKRYLDSAIDLSDAPSFEISFEDEMPLRDIKVKTKDKKERRFFRRRK